MPNFRKRFIQRLSIRQSMKKHTHEARWSHRPFADLNGIPEGVQDRHAAAYQTWQHDPGNDSLHGSWSLTNARAYAEYITSTRQVQLQGMVQYQAATSRDRQEPITSPARAKAFRDTWRDGNHSYLTYLRDRLTVARDLLTESGSIFVQIGDENVHRVRALMDEVFGEDNFVTEIVVVKSSGLGSNTLPRQNDFILLYAKSAHTFKYRQLFMPKALDGEGAGAYQYVRAPDHSIRRLTRAERRDSSRIPSSHSPLRFGDLTKPGPGSKYEFEFNGVGYTSRSRWWGMPKDSLVRAAKAGRLYGSGVGISYQRLLSDWSGFPLTNVWSDTGTGSGLNKMYVVQTDEKIVQRCILMSTDPGDLVLDPTCGSGTTAYVAEQWGRRWITIDTSRVALALARARIMGARYPYYLLSDSRDGQLKEAEVERKTPSGSPTYNDIRQGFVHERVPHITLKSIANNAEIDVIWGKWPETLEPLRESLNAALKKTWKEWEIPRAADAKWSSAAKKLHADWWQARIARQKEIDASIAAKADYEYLYDKPYENKKTVRVAGPFTVESLSPHRVLGVGEDDELIDIRKEASTAYGAKQSFPQMILENLKTAGVQQAHKGDRIAFTALTPWPGELVCAEGRYLEGEAEKRAAIFIGPEFGTVQRADLVAGAREAGDAGFDVLIACAFNYEAHAAEFSKLGRIPVLKARMNADLHMAEDLKNTGKGNLFVIFGEPDIDLLPEPDDRLRVKVKGVDVFDPSTGEVRSDGADGIACWFIDTDYNEESFFVRHAYFLGANDPYKALKTTLKTEINQEAWETLHSDTSRPFEKPKSGRIAVKVINHLGDEVMKVFRV